MLVFFWPDTGANFLISFLLLAFVEAQLLQDNAVLSTTIHQITQFYLPEIGGFELEREYLWRYKFRVLLISCILSRREKYA